MCLCHMPMQSHALTTTKIRYCYDSDSFDELIRFKHCLNCFGLFSSQKRFVAEAELILNELLDPCKLMNPSERKCPTLKRRARNPERKKSKPVIVLSLQHWSVRPRRQQPGNATKAGRGVAVQGSWFTYSTC